MPDRKTELFS